MSQEELDYEEDQDHLNEPKRQVAIRGEAKNVRLRHRECDICFHTFTNPRRHTIQTHLPWYVAPETACWICGTQEQTANFLSKHITRCHPTNSIDATFKNREVMYAELMNGLLRDLATAQRSEFRKDNRLRFTFGIHPKIISSSSTSSLEHNWTDLQNLLKSTKTVAVGEIGLDDSTNPSRRDFERQIKYFRKQLYLATELNLTVVIHSRGRPSLHEHVLATLSEICKPDQLIHWHCFTCTAQLYSAAVSQFSNIVFGITPFILKDRYSNIVEIVKTFGITRVVLESDAPYIPLHSHTIGNPYSVHAVALKISELLQQPIEDVFRITTENSKRIYKLQ
ncbi:tatD [Mytilus coruscus]|uniref:TatD n=1 Tax=Mytilus coruscus TaxID=42192 RepID=A0A6J8DA59_MYTCO|nr:tatD [Mytilus coruscus]